MFAEHWHHWDDPIDKLECLKRRFEDDHPDSDRVVRFEFRPTPRFGRWFYKQPTVRAHGVPFSGGLFCDNIRMGVLRGDSSARARPFAVADTGREIPVAVITTEYRGP